MLTTLLRKSWQATYQAGRILDDMVTAGSLDNARYALLEARARRRALETVEVDYPGLAHPA